MRKHRECAYTFSDLASKSEHNAEKPSRYGDETSPGDSAGNFPKVPILVGFYEAWRSTYR